MRNDAATTLIPLLNMYRWEYRINLETAERPVEPIRNLLDNDAIEYVRLLPVRQYDNNEGWGRYEYQMLCYVTTNRKVFFYMSDKIYVGRHLQADNNGFESVMWDYELPMRYTESSSNHFILNRNVSSPNLDEDYLYEKPGFHTIDIELALPNYKRYIECKLFEYRSKRNSPSDPIRINRFYFKQGNGLIRYQQFIMSPTDSTLVMTYEQDLIEGN
jgi:hypothetical protein